MNEADLRVRKKTEGIPSMPSSNTLEQGMQFEQHLHMRKANNGMDQEDYENAAKELENPENYLKPNPAKDWPSIALLLLLYTLQGIPLGLSGTIPLLLQGRVSYSDQAIFSLMSLPFSMKLFWAPVVDSLYWPGFGRRKSWLVPIQMLVGFAMIAGATQVERWANLDGSARKEPIQIWSLTIFFFMLYFFMATQDIAVDGWALTMLAPQNVGYASTCNTIGQTLGFFLANVGFLAFNDKDVCNKYFRSEPSESPIVSLSSFMIFWGWVFIFTTIFVWVFKYEDPGRDHELPGSIIDTYKELMSVLRLANVQKLCVVLLTCKAAFAAADAATTLKLLEAGMPKEHLAIITPVLVTTGLLQPAVMSRWTVGPSPLALFLYGYPLRLVVSILYMFMIWYAEMTYSDNHVRPWWCQPTYFLVLLTFAALLHEAAANMMFVSQMAFFARVSDPAIGGTYMTLLNTVANFGSKWPNTLVLTLIHWFTVKSCSGPFGEIGGSACTGEGGAQDCGSLGGTCVEVTDGYDILTMLGVVLGAMWLFGMWNFTDGLQRTPQKEWYVRTHAHMRTDE